MPQFVRGRLLFDDGAIRRGADGLPRSGRGAARAGRRAGRSPPLPRRLAGAARALCRRGDAVPRGAARLPAQHPGLCEPGDALSRVEPGRRGRGRAERARGGDADARGLRASPPGCGRFSATARAPRRCRSDARTRLPRAIRRWRCSARRPPRSSPRPTSAAMSRDSQPRVQNRLRTLRTTASVTPAAGGMPSSGASAPDDASSTPTRNGTNLNADGQHAVQRLEDDRLRHRRPRRPAASRSVR